MLFYFYKNKKNLSDRPCAHIVCHAVKNAELPVNICIKPRYYAQKETSPTPQTVHDTAEIQHIVLKINKLRRHYANVAPAVFFTSLTR